MIDPKEFQELTEFAQSDSADVNELLRDSGLDPKTDFEEIDFGGMYLAGIQLNGFNLRGANFEGAVLVESDFQHANLEGAIFDRANIRRSDFSGSETSGASFNEVWAKKARGVPTTEEPKKVREASVLFVDDEPESIQSNVRKLDDLLPWIEIVIVTSKSEGEEILNREQFLFALFDARIPEDEGRATTGLLGTELVDAIASNVITPLRDNMRYVILTEHRLAIQNEFLMQDERRMGILEKGEDMTKFEDVIRCVHALSMKF